MAASRRKQKDDRSRRPNRRSRGNGRTSKNSPGRRPKSDFSDDSKIEVLVDKNPHARETQEHRRFRLFRTGQTVADNLASQKKAGLRQRRAAIRREWQRGHINLERPAPRA